MTSKFPGAVSLGYAILFITLWLFFMPFAGWFSFGSAAAAMPTIMILGGVVLAIAGIFSFFNENKIDTIIFLILGAVNYSFAARFSMMPNLAANSNYSAIDGWIIILLTAVIFLLWLASMKGDTVKQIFLLGLWLAFLAGAIANWFALAIFAYIGGYLGLISSLLAGWYFATTIITKKESTPA